MFGVDHRMLAIHAGTSPGPAILHQQLDKTNVKQNQV
jgi:hypothetical protein